MNGRGFTSSVRRLWQRGAVKRVSSLLAVVALLAAHGLLPLAAIAQESGGVRVEPGSEAAATRLLPGMQPIANLILGPESTLTFFHAPAGTYDPAGPTPEAAAAAIEAGRSDPEFRVLKVYSVVELDVGMYAVRYQSNQSLGITRNMVFDEVVVVNPETGPQAGGFYFIDPIYAMQWPDPDPAWGTVVGGIGAVAAAAAAMAAAFASGGAAAGAAGAAGASSGGDNSDPNRVVGHLLQLSARRIDVTPVRPAALEASVWRVKADGSYEAAPDCEIILGVPEGFSASAERGFGSLSATISQKRGAHSPTWMAVYANGPASGTTDQIEVVGEVESQIVWHLEPADKRLVPNGRDAAVLVADVTLSPSAQADPAINLEAVRDSITFAPGGEWGETSSPAVWTDGGRAVNVIARSPQPDKRLATPAEIPVSLAATVGEEQLTARAIVPCEALPELEVEPEELEFAQDCGRSFEFAVEVKNHAGAQWQFEVTWDEGATPLGELSLDVPTGTRTTVTLAEAPPAKADFRNPVTVSRIKITATAEDFDDLERTIPVSSIREGLFADTLSMSPDRTYHIAADGSAKVTDIGFRAYVADPNTGQITADPGLVRNLLIEPNEEPGTPQHNAWQFAKFEPAFAEMRDTGRGPTAVYRFSTAEKIPGKSASLPIAAWVSVPGRDRDTWGYDLRLTLDTPASAPGSPAWQVEYDRAKKIIEEFTPWRYRADLMDILERRGKALGAEGLCELRKRIWYVSADLILAEGAEGYKQEEAWANRIYVVLDWAQWAGDIAFGVVVGFYLGPHSAFAAQILKPTIVSAIIAYREGQTPEQWLRDQLWGFVAILEGKAIDPDNFAKLPGSSKAKGWAIYVSYHFFKEYFYNGKTFYEAMKSVSLNVSEELLAGWLNGKVRETGVPATTTKPEDATIRSGDPVKPADASPTRAVDPARPADTSPARPVANAPRPADSQRPAPDATKPADQSTRPPDETDWDAEARKWLGQDSATKPAEGSKPAEPTAPADGAKPAEPAPDTDTDTRRKPPEPESKRPPRPEPPKLSDTARRIAEHTTTGPDGLRYVDPETALDIMRDPTKVRDLKNAPPDVQRAFENTRQAIYQQHDTKVVDAVRRLPGMYGQKVKVLEFRTPGKGGSDLNTDRDFRVCYEGRDPVSGNRVWIEIPRSQWEGASAQAFSEATGGPRPADPDNPTPSEADAMRHWAESHQQLATDKGHMEASLDFTDQGYTINPADGSLVKTQVTPNIELVKRGQSTLRDADGLGRMFETKVQDATARGHTAEGFAQARKGVEQLEGVRAGYEKQGYDVGTLPPKMQETMHAVAEAGRNSTDPAAVQRAQQALQDGGFKSLGDFMSKLSGQYSSLGRARKP